MHSTPLPRQDSQNIHNTIYAILHRKVPNRTPETFANLPH
jgi:hypothetical protein